MAQTRKRPWLAVLLSFVFPGVGQMYLRAWVRGLAWLLLAFSIPLGLLITGELPMTSSVTATMDAIENVPMYAQLTMFAVTSLSMIDAYVLAARHNKRLSQPGPIGGDDASEGSADSVSCPECGHDLDDPELGFCPWCAEEFDPDEATGSRAPW